MAATVDGYGSSEQTRCDVARFFAGTRRQIVGDTLLIMMAALAPAFVVVALGRHWPLRAAVWLAIAAVAATAWVFVRQLARGERAWMFYTGMLLFGVLPGRSDTLVKAGVAPAWMVGMAVLAALPAVVGLVGAVRLVETLDEMWRQINYRALAFAFIATLGAVLAQWVLAGLGVQVLTWRALLLLMVALWGAGMMWAYRRLR